MTNPALPIATQAEQLHWLVVDLFKKYQFRDRNSACCHGVSVSQCYLLEALGRLGPQSMGNLSREMHLSVSTVTRVVDQLEKKGYAVRRADQNDRRFRRVALTPDGEELFSKIWQEFCASEQAILQQLPVEHRGSVIRFVKMLNEAVTQCCGASQCC